MATITETELIRDPAAFLARLKAGESLSILCDGHAIADVTPQPPRRQTPRPFGLAAGQIVLSDDFDDPLPEDILGDFECR